MVVLILESETRWDPNFFGFQRHRRRVEVVGPRELWRLLEPPGCASSLFLSQADDFGVQPALAFGLLSRLKRCGLVEEMLLDQQGQPQLARQLTPRFAPVAVEAGESYSFSRFALVRRSGASWILESARGVSRLRVLNEALLAGLAQAKAPLLDWQSWLVESGILIGNREQELEARSLWNFSDRLFHQRSRYGTHQEPAGKRSFAAPSSVRADSGDKILLERPAQDGPGSTFAEVLKGRRSRRQPQGGAWSLQRVGQFLHTCLACRPEGRAYPSAGGVYEIEAIVCWKDGIAGAEPGAFRYLPEEHALLALPGSVGEVDALLSEHQQSCLSQGVPTVSILLAAHFERIFARYDSIAYALILKNAGVLLHQFSLVASQMGWGGCPVGSGDSQVVARLTGEDGEALAAVAEFALW